MVRVARTWSIGRDALGGLIASMHGFSLAPKLRLGDAFPGSRASRRMKRSLKQTGSQAGAWEPERQCVALPVRSARMSSDALSALNLYFA